MKRINLDKELLDFSLLLEDVKETMGLVLDKSINLDIPSIDKELILEGDYDKLKQVIINLIKNSYEAKAKNIRLIVKINNSSFILILQSYYFQNDHRKGFPLRGDRGIPKNCGLNLLWAQ